MKPFTSPEQMLDAHELMFGAPGRACAELILKWAGTLFAVPLDTLNIRVVLAPIELGPYNRHTGYCAGRDGEGAFILANRHHVHFKGGAVTAGPEPADVARRLFRSGLTPKQIRISR
jgi:hypothetical protein